MSDWDCLKNNLEFRRTVAALIKGHRKNGINNNGKVVRKYTQELLHHDLQNNGAGVSLSTLRRCEQGRLELIGADNVQRILSSLGWELDIAQRKIVGVETYHFYDKTEKYAHSIVETELSAEAEAEISALPAFAPTLYDAGSFGWMRDNALNDFKIKTLKEQRSLEIDPNVRSKLQFSGANVVIADEGRGKSTFLRTIGIDMARSFIDQTGYAVPIFGMARNCESIFEKVITLQKTLPESPVCLIIDGLDEIDAARQRALLARLFEAASENCSFIISCRRNVFERILIEDPKLYSRVSEIFEIQEWSYESDVVEYVRKVSVRIADQALTTRFTELAKNIPDYHSVMTRPFFIQVAIYSLKSGSRNRRVGDGHVTIYDLFLFFYETWVHTELTRQTEIESAALEVMKSEVSMAHEGIAHSLLKNFGHSLSIPDLNSGSEVFRSLVENATFSILDVRKRGPSEVDVIEGFLDDSLGNFLAARAYIQRFIKSDELTYEILQTETTNEVNVFIRAWLSQVDPKVRVFVVGRLERVFKKASNANNFLVSEQSVYFLGRTDSMVEPKVLKEIYYDDNVDFQIRRSAALGAILFSNEELEVDFISEIRSDKFKAAINRSIQLQYFGDVGHRLFAFSDDTGITWDKTRKATFKRLSESDTRACRLRLWDIETVRSFLFSRAGSKLTSREEKILRGLSHEAEATKGRNGLISATINDILSSIKVQEPL
ncbi:NACHT domain-containing NTPase [Donghicola sp. XS_ASV15]|uniref:NACHT domain-containing protein n=1 Tax=Donghicola sp. XS_ASV15 TaxID=3241295 RepID=UPI003516766D